MSALLCTLEQKFEMISNRDSHPDGEGCEYAGPSANKAWLKVVTVGVLFRKFSF